MDKDDRREIMRLRNYYRKNFQNGENDECFLLWIEGSLEDLHNIDLFDTIPEYVPGDKPIEDP